MDVDVIDSASFQHDGAAGAQPGVHKGLHPLERRLMPSKNNSREKWRNPLPSLRAEQQGSEQDD